MILKNLSIFLNGGAGFIGSHLAEMLAKDNRVTAYDNFSSAVLTDEILKTIPNVTFVRGDMRDKETISRAMRGHDVVIHLAAAHIRLSLSNPHEVHDVNTTGVLTTLLAAKQNRIQRFIYLSSSEIYGSAKNPLIREDDPKDPTTVYGVSKYIGELYTQYFHRHEGLPSMIIRLFNTYGPRAHFEDVYGEVIPRMCVRALCGEPPIIFGTGEQTRDFTYITDTIDGIIKASSEDSLLGDVVNIAYGQEVSIKHVAEAIKNETGVSPVYRPARPHDVVRHAADTTKAKNVLQWNPKINIAEGIKRYLSWLKNTYPDPKALLSRVPEKNW
ncbi:MAG: GDP-mannose 4,6-dehydratase [Patescibacteria group bacterium]|nr:GDP-mannose 4,6-dehydratase [Patescibacteria group bacterium]